ncbi:MAG: glycerol-3-phosphate dehydrogenase/oxidase [Acidimicrobiia bacterium]
MPVQQAPSRLNPHQRMEHLRRMDGELFDIVVVGGGVTGCGVALDAVTRGLSVALLEQRDLGSGTSSRSSKLFHGGLRYLEQRNFKLVKEALGERNLMINRLCPHLVQPVPFVYPLRHRIWERAYVGAGVALYDLLASLADNPLPRHRHLGKRTLLREVPSLEPGALVGGVLYWDAVVDDARHTMILARTAAAHGALLATSTRVVGITMGNGRVDGVRARDLEGGSEITVRARRVINASGVWSDDIQQMAGGRGLDVRASKGIHILVPRDRVHAGSGVILRTEKSVLFLIPWGRCHWIIGTTDTPWELGRAHPAASRTDIDYLLTWVNTMLTDPLGPGDVIGVYAGLRPLLVGESDETSKLSREHAVLEAESGLVSIAGGKYTTYRVMARDAVDVAAGGLGDVPPSRTHLIPLLGAEPGPVTSHEAFEALDEEGRLRLRYGSLRAEVTALADNPPIGQARLVDDAPYTRAEIVYAASHEGALHLDDILTRRTRISIETADRGVAAAEATARLVAPTLGWDEKDIRREIDHYRSRVSAELDSQGQPNDRTADAARMGAADVRTGWSE